MPPRPAPPDWAAIRIRYEETDDPAAAICTDHGIDKEDLTRIAKREKWRRQNPRPFPPLRRPAPIAATNPPPVSRSAPPRTRVRERVGEGLAPPSPTDPTPARGKAARKPRVAKKSSSRSRAKPKAAPTRPAARKTPATVAEPAPTGAPPAPAKKPPARKPTKAATATARRKLLDRMVAAISLKLEQLERRMTQHLDNDDGDDAASATDHERETRAIGALIDNLGKVTEMETGLARTGKTDAVASDLGRDADRWRQELAQRLARIVGAAKS